MVGVALIEQCIENGVQVLALVRKNSNKCNRLPISKLVTISECNLNELKYYNSFKGEYDVFYHLGWSNTDRAGRCDARKQIENIEYSLDAIQLAHKLGCTKFVGAGSQAEYGIHKEPKTKPTSELNPQDAYGISKVAAGKLCSSEAIKMNMDFSWVRIFSLYGKYELPGTLIQTVLPRMLRNEYCALTEGSQEWDYLYSSDAGKAFFLVGEKASGNKIYCLGQGEAHPIKQYILKIKKLTNSKSELGFGDIPYYGEKPKGMCADITELCNDVGWQPETTFESGILKEIERIKGMTNEEN